MYLVEMGSPVRQEDVPEEKAEIYHQLTAWVEKSGGRAMEPPKTMPSMTRRKTPTGIRPSPAKRTPSGYVHGVGREVMGGVSVREGGRIVGEREEGKCESDESPTRTVGALTDLSLTVGSSRSTRA